MINPVSSTQHTRCAIYTRKSTEEGLEQAFNSLHAQREACEAYALSQQHEGWVLLSTIYDDGGFSGGSMERPALKQLLSDIESGLIDTLLVYKVDRLSRSLADFVRLIERFEQLNISFVSVTQQFNTSTSMGRLTLNVLLSFAQFEREVTSERIRDKIAASKKKGLWMGGIVALGFNTKNKQLVINEREAQLVNHIYRRYLALGCVRRLKNELDVEGKTSKPRKTRSGVSLGKPFSRGALYHILKNPLYIGKISYKGDLFEGQHAGIVEPELWKQVHTRLRKNQHKKRTRTESQDPSLLAGLIQDDAGNRMSPTHSKKGNRRYRYYVSQAVLQFKDKQAGSVIRVSATNIERLVLDYIFALFSDAHQLLAFVDSPNLPADQHALLISRAQSFTKQWPDLKVSQQIEFLQSIINMVTLGKELVTIQVRSNSVKEILLTSDHALPLGKIEISRVIKTLEIPVQFRRCGIETKLVIANSDMPFTHSSLVKALQVDLLRAIKWNNALMSGEVKTLVDLGKRDKVNPRYLKVLLQLAYLAPDIMSAIAQGNIPPTFTVRELKKGFPLDWQEQRHRFFGNHQ